MNTQYHQKPLSNLSAGQSSSPLRHSSPLVLFARNGSGSDSDTFCERDAEKYSWGNSNLGIAITCVLVFIKLLIILLLTSQFSGCATSPGKNNKNIFEQALILQQVSPADNKAVLSTRTEKISSDQPLVWNFPQGEKHIKQQQVTEFYSWLATVKNFEGALLVLEQGPDWLTSIKRGDHIRSFVPRGLKVRQVYQAKMPAHQVRLSLQGSNNQQLTRKQQISATARNQQLKKNSKKELDAEQLMALIRQGGRYGQ